MLNFLLKLKLVNVNTQKTNTGANQTEASSYISSFLDTLYY